MGHKGTQFPILQFMAQSVPSSQMVTMTGKDIRHTGCPNLNIQVSHV